MFQISGLVTSIGFFLWKLGLVYGVSRWVMVGQAVGGAWPRAGGAQYRYPDCGLKLCCRLVGGKYWFDGAD